MTAANDQSAAAEADGRNDKILAMDETQFRAFVDDQLRAYAARFDAMQEALAENTALTRAVAGSTAEIVTAFEVTKKGFTFFSAVGHFLNRFACWSAPIFTLAGVVWALLHGHWPKANA